MSLLPLQLGRIDVPKDLVHARLHVQRVPAPGPQAMTAPRLMVCGWGACRPTLHGLHGGGDCGRDSGDCLSAPHEAARHPRHGRGSTGDMSGESKSCGTCGASCGEI